MPGSPVSGLRCGGGTGGGGGGGSSPFLIHTNVDFPADPHLHTGAQPMCVRIVPARVPLAPWASSVNWPSSPQRTSPLRLYMRLYVVRMRCRFGLRARTVYERHVSKSNVNEYLLPRSSAQSPSSCSHHCEDHRIDAMEEGGRDSRGMGGQRTWCSQLKSQWQEDGKQRGLKYRQKLGWSI